MDYESARRIEVELAKLNYLLECHWAAVALKQGATPEHIGQVAETLCQDYETAPATVHGNPMSDEAMAETRDLVSARIASFFAGVRARVQKARSQLP